MAGCAVMLMRAEQSLPTAGSNTTKQACVVLLQEMKFDHQDQKTSMLSTNAWNSPPYVSPHLRADCFTNFVLKSRFLTQPPTV